MKTIYRDTLLFWFILLILALINATLREIAYKPLLEPFIGMWAHQLSAGTAILLFTTAIYFFLKARTQVLKSRELLVVGLMLALMTILFEVGMNVLVRHLSWQEVLETYYFWKGELWIFVLLSLVISPLLVHKWLESHRK